MDNKSKVWFWPYKFQQFFLKHINRDELRIFISRLFHSIITAGKKFKVWEMNSIKCQNLVIFSFKRRMKHKFSLPINQI